jgi:hypothetical protein
MDEQLFMGRTVIPCVLPFLGTLKKISECDWPVLARLPRLIHFKPSPLDAAPHLPCLLKIQLWPCGLVASPSLVGVGLCQVTF